MFKYFIFLFILTGCVSFNINSLNDNQLDRNKKFYIFLEPPFSNKFNDKGCQKTRKEVSYKIYNFLKKKNIDITFIEKDFSNDFSIYIENNDGYIILPTIVNWNNIDYMFCKPNNSKITSSNSTNINIVFYDIKNQKYSAEYNLNAKDTSIFFIADSKLIFEEELKRWWKKYQE